MSTLTIGGSQSGGTADTLIAAGQDSSGRVRFALSTHTALSQRLISIGVKTQPVTEKSLGAQEVSVDFIATEAEPSEGCCSIQSGGVYFNLKMRRAFNQPDALVDEVIDVLQGVAFAQFLSDALKKGIVTL